MRVQRVVQRGAGAGGVREEYNKMVSCVSTFRVRGCGRYTQMCDDGDDTDACVCVAGDCVRGRMVHICATSDGLVCTMGVCVWDVRVYALRGTFITGTIVQGPASSNQSSLQGS